MSFSGDEVLHAARVEWIRMDGLRVAVAPDAPRWLVTDERGERLLGALDRPRAFGEVVADYARATGAGPAEAWLDADTLLADAERAGLVARAPLPAEPYPGRAALLRPERLRDFWIHINDRCNLRCRHCLVSSSPDRGDGLPPTEVARVAREARALGACNLLVTGGEPLIRDDLPALAREWIEAGDAAHVVVLTNGMLLRGDRLDRLAALPHGRLALQVSLDGPDAASNDPVRGQGSFLAAVTGARAAVAAGLRVTITTTITARNAPVIERMPVLAREVGAAGLHLLWPHRRGRALSAAADCLPPVPVVVDAYRRARAAARAEGVTLDNLDSLRLRIDGPPGVKHDLSSAAWTSLCLGSDGRVYPSAALAGVAELALGDTAREPLAVIWREGAVGRLLRSLSVRDKPQCRDCAFRFLCGGGDLEHGYLHSSARGARERLLSDDPYCDLYQAMIADTFADLGARGGARLGRRGGFDRPVALAAMGEAALACGADGSAAPVRTVPSACVLSLDVAERSRELVREFYTRAAGKPQPGLCCPVRPAEEDLAHIPREVVERFYGCGSPVADAAPREGETLLDLGSGAGIDCFVAARKVGGTGRVIGVDMTDAMIEIAERCRAPVAAALGHDVVEFRKGAMESLPVADASIDVVTSNCVINLSPDKPAVLAEVWRVLRDGGRMCVADIVGEGPLPPGMRANAHLWGECLGGALPEADLLALVERAGFFGVQVLRRSFWREVEGHRFLSITVRAWKLAKQQGCVYRGQTATYLGPLKAGIDEEGHLFPRGVAVQVCTDTAAKLRAPAYTGHFLVREPDGEGEVTGGPECDPAAGCC